MSRWSSKKAKRVLAALLRIGWSVKRQGGKVARWQGGTSHKVLQREGRPNYVFAFHDGDEIGPRMMARIARKTELKPEDL